MPYAFALKNSKFPWDKRYYTVNIVPITWPTLIWCQKKSHVNQGLPGVTSKHKANSKPWSRPGVAQKQTNSYLWNIFNKVSSNDTLTYERYSLPTWNSFLKIWLWLKSRIPTWTFFHKWLLTHCKLLSLSSVFLKNGIIVICQKWVQRICKSCNISHYYPTQIL